MQTEEEIWIPKTEDAEDSGCIGGHIESSVFKDNIPNEHEQSNFGCIGNPYTYDDGSGMIMVFMDNEEYHIF